MEEARAASVRHRVEHDQLFYDSAVVAHGFAPFLRDYDVIVEVPAANSDGTGSYIAGRYRYRFTHCAEALARTALTAETWRMSWDDLFTDYGAWESAGGPAGFVWGVCWADAEPGMSYIDRSRRAGQWANRLEREMHEVRIATNVLILELIFHDLRVDQLADGEPTAGTVE